MDKAEKLLEAIIKKCGFDCPNCDNCGIITGGNETTGPEQEQCEWCYTYPSSKFQLRLRINSAFTEIAEETEIKIANDLNRLDYDGIDIWIKSALVTEKK